MQTKDFDDYEDRFEKLKAAHGALQENKEIVLSNMQKLADESGRVADVAHNSREIIKDLDREFESQTGLTAADMPFLFLCTGLQILRWVFLNELTREANAGPQNKLEKLIKENQKKMMKHFDDGTREVGSLYYAPRNQIIFTSGVPYDITAFKGDEVKDNMQGFQGIKNHRFATLGHDPILGLLFGTANILTNTITFSANDVKIGKYIAPKIITSNHVEYSYNNKFQAKSGQISLPASTIHAIVATGERAKEDTGSFVAALVKQLLHIGTDIFTTAGLTIPGANLILDNKYVEQLAKYIDAGDIIEVGLQYTISLMINKLISALHLLMYKKDIVDSSKYASLDIYSVKTRKIILISNCIASSSNVLWVGANMYMGNGKAIKELDIGGIIVTIQRLIHDPEYIRQVKEEFVLGNFKRMIQGDTLKLEEVKPWALEIPLNTYQ